MTFTARARQGIAVALEAQRRGWLDDDTLALILAYYDTEGAESPLPVGQVLANLGRLGSEQVVELAQGLVSGTASPVGGKFTDRLSLLNKVGEGGMGAVYRGYDRLLRRVVAIKVIRGELLDTSEEFQAAVARFRREAEVMARVEHPAIVNVHSVGLSKRGEPYMVMDFVKGKTLAELLREAPLDPRQLARWWSALASGLQACHDAGVVHRDVKPANVLINASGRALLTDFGIALDGKAHTKLTNTGVSVGTVCYMPPEQAVGELADGRADVYSAGASLFEALTGEPVFRAGSLMELLVQIATVDPRPVRELRSDVPADLEAVVAQCLEKDPADRYPTATALAEDLERFLKGDPVKARPVRAKGLRKGGALRLALALGVAATAIAVPGLSILETQRAQRGLNAHLKWDAETLQPRFLGLVEVPGPPSLEELDRRLADLARHQEVLDDKGGHEAYERLVAYMSWRGRDAESAIPEATSSRSAAALVVDARRFVERGDLREARARLRRAKRRRPGFAPAEFLELMILAKADPSELVRKAGSLELPNQRAFAGVLLNEALEPLWDKAIGASLSRSSERVHLLRALADGAELVGDTDRLATTKTAALGRSEPAWTRQLVDPRRALEALERLIEVTQTAPPATLPLGILAAVDEGLKVLLDAAHATEGNDHQEEKIRRAIVYERVAYERLAPRLRQADRMRVVLNHVWLDSKTKLGNDEITLDPEIVFALLRYGCGESTKALARQITSYSIERLRVLYPKSQAPEFLTCYAAITKSRNYLGPDVLEHASRAEVLLARTDRPDINVFARAWLLREVALAQMTISQSEGYSALDEARKELRERALRNTLGIVTLVKGARDHFDDRIVNDAFAREAQVRSLIVASDLGHEPTHEEVWRRGVAFSRERLARRLEGSDLLNEGHAYGLLAEALYEAAEVNRRTHPEIALKLAREGVSLSPKHNRGNVTRALTELCSTLGQ